MVALAENLQTTYWRVDRPVRQWLSIDLAPVIELRERLLPSAAAVRHLPVSALDRAWMDEVDADAGVVITAKGLLMYLQPERSSALRAVSHLPVVRNVRPSLTLLELG